MSNRIMDLAVQMSHVYSFVGGEDFPIAHAALQAEVTRVEAELAEAKVSLNFMRDDRDELRARLVALEGQEPAYWVAANQTFAAQADTWQAILPLAQREKPNESA